MTERISRRTALSAIGGVSLGALLAACSDGRNAITNAEVSTSDGSTATVEPQTPSGTATSELFDDAASCVLTAEETEGPYYFDVDSIRSDITENRAGTALRLAVRVQDADACMPIENAVVDLWHCDAEGIYSGFETASLGGAAGGGRTDDDTFMRGAQVTNADGTVQFRTIYPGWYRGRTVHIHAKVHVDGSTALTTQFFFDENVTETVYRGDPYGEHTGRDTFNENDSIFDPSLILTLSGDGDGYLGVITLGVRSP
jgi:protocatechuate 3,4-dioxygenase beta subunit